MHYIDQELPQDVVIASRLQLVYVPLEVIREKRWEQNPKLHDYPLIKQSIRTRGYKDPAKFEPTLNDGRGGLVEGNGRTETLWEMYEDGEPVPAGIGIDGFGKWWVPVLFGVDAASQAEAASYAVDHNWLTVAPLGAEATAGMWDAGMMMALSPTLGDHRPLALKGADLIALMTGQTGEGDGEGFEKSSGDDTLKLRLTMAEPIAVVEPGQVYELGRRHILVVVDVVTEVEEWANWLSISRQSAAEKRLSLLFCPYPDPSAPIGLRGEEEALMLLIQPDAFIAGHLIDQYRNVHGEESVEQLR